MNPVRLCPLAFILILIGCKPAQDAPPKPSEQVKAHLKEFSGKVLLAEMTYSNSRNQFGYILKTASKQGYEDNVILASLKTTDLSFITTNAVAAYKLAIDAEKDFDFLYTNSKNVSTTLRDDFFQFKKIIERNATFLSKADDGEMTTGAMKQWGKDMEEMERVYKNINLEIEKLKAN